MQRIIWFRCETRWLSKWKEGSSSLFRPKYNLSKAQIVCAKKAKLLLPSSKAFPLSSTSPPCWNHSGASTFPLSLDFEVSPVRAARPAQPSPKAVFAATICTTVLLLPCSSSSMPLPCPRFLSRPGDGPLLIKSARIIIALNRVGQTTDQASG